MSALLAWRMNRTEAQARRRYARYLRRLAASPYCWDGWLNALADAARLVSGTTTDDDQAEMWLYRSELVRNVAAAQCGQVLIRAGEGPTEVWERGDCWAMWHNLAVAPDDDAAAAVLDALFRRLQWPSAGPLVGNAALVLGQLADARRSAGRARRAALAAAVAEMTSDHPEPDGRTYTDPGVLTLGVAEGWADPETDPARIDWPPRQAAAAIPFQVIDGRPVSPCGYSTGIRYGRNEFGHWGEALMADALVTATTCDGRCRWLLMIERRDGHGWGVPGGHVDPGETTLYAALRELAEETGLEAPASALVAEMPARHVPDPRASDEAWAVTVPVHVDLGDVGSLPHVAGGDDARRAAWIRADTYDGLVTDLERHYARLGTDARVFAAHAPMLAGFLGGGSGE